MYDNNTALNSTISGETTDNHGWSMAPDHILVISNVLSILGLVLNIPHAIILYKMPVGKYLGAQNNRKLLLGVAFLDILSSLIKIPLDSYDVQHFLDQTTWFCAITAVLGYASHIATEGMLMIGCIDHLIIIKSPTTYASTCLAQNFCTFIGFPVIWTFSFISIYVGLFHDKILGPRGFSMCYLNMANVKSLNILTTSSILVPIAVTFVTYYIICCVMHHADMTRHSKSIRFSYRVASYIFGTMAVTLIAWIFAPLNLILSGIGKFNLTIYYMGPLMVYTSAIIHPIMYGVAVRTYRNYIKRLLGFKMSSGRRGNAVGPSGQIDDSST